MNAPVEYALFANVENPFDDAPRALRESVDTIVHAETLGFEQVWLTEHHFNPFSISAALLPLLAYLAARTTRIKLGAGALLLPFHDPVRVAEDLATIDALADGRLLLGVGRGGPFPEQFRHFGIAPEDSRARLFEALDLIEEMLQKTPVDRSSGHYRYDKLAVFPRPLRPRLPTWLASLNDDSLRLAAQRGYGLMGPSAAPVEKLREALASFAAYADRPALPAISCAPTTTPPPAAKPRPSSATSAATCGRSTATTRIRRRCARSARPPRNSPTTACWPRPSSATRPPASSNA